MKVSNSPVRFILVSKVGSTGGEETPKHSDREIQPRQREKGRRRGKSNIGGGS